MFDHRRKLEWARKHLDTLDHSIGVFRKSTPCHLTIKFNPETRENEARVTQLKPMSPDWSMMVGDIVHGMRSSLDSLVYALVVKEQRGAPADHKILRTIQFPICDSPENFKTEAYRIKLVPDLAKTAIEGLQPYMRPIPREFHPLAVLRDLSNIDKHRHIILTYARGSDLSIEIFGPNLPVGSKFGSGFEGTIEEGTLVGRLAIYAYPGGPAIPFPTEMEVNPNLALEILFGAGKYTGPVVPVFRSLHDRIRDEIFPQLEAFL